MNLTNECTDFPEPPNPEITRNDVLELIEDQFAGEVRLLLLDGAEGTGKTTVCSQFARRHADRSISIFVRPSTRLTVDPGYLKTEVARQTYAALKGRPGVEDQFTEGFTRTALAALQRRARQERKPYFFVVDGLADLKDTEAFVKESVLEEILPWSYDWFRFLVTGNHDDILPYIRKTPSYQGCLIPRVHATDAREFFGDLRLQKEDHDLIESVCRGNPSRLAQLLRILRASDQPRADLLDLQQRAPNLFQVEWQTVDRSNSTQRFLIAVLAHDRRDYNVHTLAAVTKLDPSEVTSLLAQLTFLVIDEHTGNIDFASEPHRRFAADALKSLEPAVNIRIIDSLLDNSEGDETIITLPAYFEKTGRYSELLNFLGGSHVSQVMERTHSLALVRQRVRLGANTARRLNKHAELMRFSMHNSVIQEVSGVDIWGQEVGALAAVGDYSNAIRVAQNAVLREDALHLIAIVAKAQQEQTGAVDAQLVDQINTLYEQIDPAELGGRALDIASTLVAVSPEVAIQLMERAAKAGDGSADPNSLDLAFTHLSVAASLSKPAAITNDVTANIRTRIKSKHLQGFSDAVSVMVRKSSPADVIARVESMDRIADRMYVIRHWTVTNAAEADAIIVAEYGLKLLVQNGTYSTNALLFRQLAAPLLYTSSNSAARLVRSLNVHGSTIEAAGPTTEYVRFQLALAAGERHSDRNSSELRLIELYEYVRNIRDLHTRAEATAWFMDTLKAIDGDGSIEQSLGLTSTLEGHLSSDVADLLERSADHYESAKHIVRALASRSTDKAFDIISCLNTEPRRDSIFDELIDSTLDVSDLELSINTLVTILGKIQNPDLRDHALVRVCERLAHVNQSAPMLAKDFSKLLQPIGQLRNLRARCQACSFGVAFLKSQRDSDERQRTLLDWQASTWEKIGPGWRRQTTAFEIASDLAKFDRELANEFIARARAEREVNGPDRTLPVNVFVASLQLAIRAWTGLLQTQKTVDDTFRRLSTTIDRIPDAAERAALYSDLAARCSLNGRPNDCRRIVLDKVDPLIIELEPDVTEVEETLILAAPALYFTYDDAVFDRLAKLNYIDLDRALMHICNALLTRMSPLEPYEYVYKRGTSIEHPDLLKVVSMISRMTEDSLIYHYICRVCDTLTDTNHIRIGREQANQYPDKLLEVIENKLPSERFIRHDGFVIASKAQVYRLRSMESAQWEELVTSAKAIRNAADQAYVLGVIASALPARERKRRKVLYEEASGLVQKLPASADKASRFTDLAELMLDTADISRECLRCAMEACRELSDERTLDKRERRIIDVAHRIDPDFAASLASLKDDDPAKARKRAEAQARLRTLNLKRELGKHERHRSAGKRDPDLPQAAWLKLAALNADPSLSHHQDELADIAEAIGLYPLNEAYPILAWLIQNSVVRFRAHEIAATRLTPIFDATLTTAEFSQRLSSRSSELSGSTPDLWDAESSDEVMIVGPGQRMQALQFITDWARREARNYIYIVDPYFGMADLEILKLIRSAAPDVNLQVLTGLRAQEKEACERGLPTAYQNYWRVRISSELSADAELWISGVGEVGDCPIKDRLILTDGGGLDLSGSFNGLGSLNATKEIRICRLTSDQLAKVEERVVTYLVRKKRDFNGQRISYTPVML